jgi:hypothetical protein
MKHRVALAALLALFAAHAARADVTIRRTMTVNLGSSFPAAMQDMLKQQLASSVPSGSVIRIKGTKSSSDIGPLVVLSDSASSQVTLLNPKTKQYATGSFSDYMDKLAASVQATSANLGAMPAEAQQILQSMKLDVQTKKTGQVGTIQGILAEESVITMSLGMSVGGAAMPMMRMEMHCWIAQPNEVARIGGLQELTDYTARNKSSFGDPTEMLSKLFGQMPGMGEQLRKEMTAIMSLNGSLMLKMSVGAYIPAMAQLMQQAGQSTAGVDPNAPMMQMQSDLTELSTASIDDSAFAVPADYQAAPMEDLVKGMLPTLPRPTPAALQ